MMGRIARRAKYQPTFDSHGNFVGGRRDSRRRLHIIKNEVDFTGKRVLDLGCSGGFFSFSTAREAKCVTGVDANAELIARDRENADRFGYDNVEFICQPITTSFLERLPHYDIVLFLSVLHHLIARTVTYAEWDHYEIDDVMKILAIISRMADVYVFEMGQPDECERWSPALERVVGNPREWIPEHVFKHAFESVTILTGAAYQRFPYRRFPGLYAVDFGSSPAGNALNWIKRQLIRMGGVNPRDFRDIYIGSRI